jgi:predicted RNase H-like HicB family nuclease
VRLAPAQEGGFVVSCRDLPQLVTQGDDLAHALAEAPDAMGEVFAAYRLGGLPLPAPSKLHKGEHVVSPPAGTLAKAALHVAVSEAGITKVLWPSAWASTSRRFAGCWTRTMDRSCRAATKPLQPWAAAWSSAWRRLIESALRPEKIAGFLRGLLGLPGVRTASAEQVAAR